MTFLNEPLHVYARNAAALRVIGLGAAALALLTETDAAFAVAMLAGFIGALSALVASIGLRVQVWKRLAARRRREGAGLHPLVGVALISIPGLRALSFGLVMRRAFPDRAPQIVGAWGLSLLVLPLAAAAWAVDGPGWIFWAGLVLAGACDLSVAGAYACLAEILDEGDRPALGAAS